MKLDVRKILLYLCLFLMIGCSIAIGYSLKKCDCDVEVQITDEDIDSEKYMTKLSTKLLEYLDDIYNNDKWMNGGIEPIAYDITLRELETKGYDISMFVNPNTGKMCDLDKTYGSFIIMGTKEDGKTDYTYSTNISCIKVNDED